jgi:CRISPR-associated endonuclease/helicase Cas3
LENSPAFVDGFKTYQETFDKQSKAYCGLICDRLPPEVIEADQDNFNSTYQKYISEMASVVAKVTKMYQISDELRNEEDFFNAITTSAVTLHERHHWLIDGVEVSIGLVRVANITTCLKVADRLISEPMFHIVTYHSLELLARRAYKEYHLDRLLNRKSKNLELEKHLSKYLTDKNITDKKAIFIVVATPVEEVGRDHDFDWAIIEPSSMHSIVQTAGRVNRHRREEIKKANIVVLNRCYRDVSGRSRGGRVFFWPGNEIVLDSGSTSHGSHEMRVLLGKSPGEEAALDVRLMFGDNKCLFATYDERALEEQLKPIKSHLQSGQIAWFSQWFGEAYPLRRNNKQELYSLMSKGEINEIYLYKTELKNGRLISGWTHKGEKKDKNAPPNAWLSPSLQEVKKWLEEVLKHDASYEHFSFTVEEWRDLDASEVPFDWRGVIPKAAEAK